MRRSRDPRPYLQDMLDSIERIRRYTEGMDPAAFHEDQVVQDAARCSAACRQALSTPRR